MELDVAPPPLPSTLTDPSAGNGRGQGGHVIGGYRFKIIKFNCEQRDRLNILFGGAGLKSIDEFLEKYADEITGFMTEKRIGQAFYNLILEFDDRTFLHGVCRRLWMRWLELSKAQILRTITLEQEVEVFHDFFIQRLGIRTLWASSLKNMASSFRITTAAEPTLN